MGVYVDPTDRSKETWLQEHGVILVGAPAWGVDFNPDTHLPVCLIDNGPWTAAGIAWCQQELDRFLADLSGRPRTWWLVSIDNLHAVCPRLRYYLED